VIAAERLVEAGREQHLTQNQNLAAGRQPVRARDRRASLIYISWYINGYGRPQTPLDVNPKMGPVHGQFAGSDGVLPVTTEQMVSSHVPSAGQYPRRGAGRKGA
jgi:hypothetical protein